MSFSQKFRPRKYILDSSVFMHSCQTAVSNYISHDHHICIKQLFISDKLQHFEEFVKPGKTCYRWQNQSIFFFKKKLHGNISLRFGLENMEGFSEFWVTQQLFQKCFTKCLTNLFDDVMQNCHFLCFSLKQKFFFMNRFIIPNLVNL